MVSQVGTVAMAFRMPTKKKRAASTTSESTPSILGALSALKSARDEARELSPFPPRMPALKKVAE